MNFAALKRRVADSPLSNTPVIRTVLVVLGLGAAYGLYRVVESLMQNYQLTHRQNPDDHVSTPSQVHPYNLLILAQQEVAVKVADYFLSKGGNGTKEPFAEYGVLVTDNPSEAAAFLRTYNIGAVLAGRSDIRSIETLAQTGLPDFRRVYIDNVVNAAGKIDSGQLAFLEIRVRQAAMDQVRQAEGRRNIVTGFFEAREHKNTLLAGEKLPDEVAKAITDLVGGTYSRQHEERWIPQILPKRDEDSHRGAGWATNVAGRIIDPRKHYDGPGIFSKIDLSGNVPRYVEDYSLFFPHDGPKFAQPYAAVPIRGTENSVIVMEYFIGPTVAYALNEIQKRREDVTRPGTRQREELDSIVEELLMAHLGTNAFYFAQKRSGKAPTEERINAAVSHYVAAEKAVAQAIGMIAGASAEDEYLSLSMIGAESAIASPAYWGICADMSLRNAKILGAGIEEPDIGELLGLFLMPPKRILGVIPRQGEWKEPMRAAEIKKKLGVYDIGYTQPEDRHVIEMAGRAIYSAYLSTDMARRIGFMRKYLEQVHPLQDTAPPKALGSLFFVLCDFRYARFVEDTIGAAVRTEVERAIGGLRHDSYLERQELYRRNIGIYLEGWKQMNVLAAGYHERFPRGASQGQFWDYAIESAPSRPVADMDKLNNPHARRYASRSMLVDRLISSLVAWDESVRSQTDMYKLRYPAPPAR